MRRPTAEELVSRSMGETLKAAFLMRSRIRDRFYGLQRRRRDPDFFRRKEKRLYHGIRDRLIIRLGGKCKKCGFLDKRGLQLDHIKGDGYKERNGRTLYKRLLDMDLEEVKNNYQILCANCNWIKRFENNEVAYRRKILS